ncbi:MAG: shikimate dehydrogenase [Victivallales bacterium]|jgi:shikimate dehydrogenase|nr:shikimate dehydrogenase [Victivallales bacterium]
MRNYAVIGDPVEHSRSPGMQNAAFEFYGLGSPYGKYRVRPDELANFVEFAKRELAGFNCTVPHKSAIIPFLDQVDPDALAALSVNTVKIDDQGRLNGTSTDGYGLGMALQQNFGANIDGATICFVGCGGAAHATSFHLARRGVKAIRLVNRTLGNAEELATALQAAFPALSVEISSNCDNAALERYLEQSDYLIQATSLGLKLDDPPPFELGLLHAKLNIKIFDTIYLDTPLLKRAKELGLFAANGEEMLLYQGAKSFEIWTGRAAPIELMRSGMKGALSC